MTRVRIGAAILLGLIAGDARAQAGEPFSDWNVQLLEGTTFNEPDKEGQLFVGLEWQVWQNK